MQLMRTEVEDVTSPTGDLIERVRFHGEGGECVTVEMASESSADNKATALERAKAILVQTATFDAAANAYDAESNGNFDEVTVTAAVDEGIYVFEYRDGEGSRQIPPSRMPSAEAARQEAVRCAIDVLVDLQPGTDGLSGWLVRVRDEAGTLLCAITVEEAEAALKARGEL